MNYYQHHIGDFDKSTRHLTRIERSIYLDLIFMYYDTEDCIPLDFAFVCRKILARSDEEVTAVEQVLNEFFTKTDSGWFHHRCSTEISKFHKSNSSKAAAGRASALARASKQKQTSSASATLVESESSECSTGVQQVLSGCSTNHKPITNNQEPNKNTRATSRATPAKQKNDQVEKIVALGADRQHAADWLAVRKAKRAPLTDTAITSLGREANKAGITFAEGVRLCAERGWQALKAEWLERDKQSKHDPHRDRSYDLQHYQTPTNPDDPIDF